jgi:hypothetical protein
VKPVAREKSKNSTLADSADVWDGHCAAVAGVRVTTFFGSNAVGVSVKDDVGLGVLVFCTVVGVGVNEGAVLEGEAGEGGSVGIEVCVDIGADKDRSCGVGSCGASVHLIRSTDIIMSNTYFIILRIRSICLPG